MDIPPDLSTEEGRNAHFDQLLKEAVDDQKKRPIAHRRKEQSWLGKLISAIKAEAWRLTRP